MHALLNAKDNFMHILPKYQVNIVELLHECTQIKNYDR